MATYTLGDEEFGTKGAITERCRQILRQTPDGQPVDEQHLGFLFDLFAAHDEWLQKSATGVREITTQMTEHGTRCFALRDHAGRLTDISFAHAIKCLPTARSASRQPQALKDFRDAARRAVRFQIYGFRDQALPSTSRCPISGEELTSSNAAVDHTPPDTFDQILFAFCRDRGINPLHVKIGSEDGVKAVFEDTNLREAWTDYHRQHAKLRLISRLANLRLPKTPVAWDAVCTLP